MVALSVLEFNKICALLSEHASSEMGMALSLALTPQDNIEACERLQKETICAESFLRRSGVRPVGAFSDVRASCRRAQVALALSPKELLEMAHALKAVRTAREHLTGDESSPLCSMALGLLPQRALEEEIFRCIVSEDEVSDAASPALADIRKRIRRAGERARDKLNDMIRSAQLQKALQDPIITMRNGRFVLPVKQEFRQAVPGLVHDQSASGATLFVEPMAVVELGNDIKKLEAEEREEIERVLMALTARMCPVADALHAGVVILAELDLIFAKASLAMEMRAVAPKLVDTGRFALKEARHPLIAHDAVPIDVWMREGVTGLIITGPNTGGKTVTLKTVGLLTLMAQAGLFIPAKEGSEVSVFAHVFADIGDEQSIEQSLSTFSSHMKNIIAILREADERSLALLDELGAGTDPTEGAALAMAILQELHARKTITMATTHYAELKAFAMTHEGLENASMAFDVATLRPTYKLYIGMAGKSNAFEISLRLGLPEYLVNNARARMTNEALRLEDVISQAENERRLAEAAREEAERLRLEARQAQAEAERIRAALSEKREQFLAKAREEARGIVLKARAETEDVIRELKSTKASVQTSAAVKTARDALNEQETQYAAISLREADGLPPKGLQAGERVKLLDISREATVLSAPDAKGELMVQAGILKLTTQLDNVRRIEDKAETPKGETRLNLETKSVRMEVDIRGRQVDEALLELDKYLDDASMAGLHEVLIVHGKGTGALRSGVQAHLRRHPYVKEFRLGRYGEGETGVTVVTLK